jgi:hypothetical protein
MVGGRPGCPAIDAFALERAKVLHPRFNRKAATPGPQSQAQFGRHNARGPHRALGARGGQLENRPMTFSFKIRKNI